MSKRKPILDLFQPVFTGADACVVSQTGRKLLNLWLERGVIVPAELDVRNVKKKRPYFSPVDCFHLRILRVLTLGQIPVSIAAEFARGIAFKQHPLQILRHDEGVLGGGRPLPEYPSVSASWMFNAASDADVAKPNGFLGAFAWIDDRLMFCTGQDGETIAKRFAPDQPFMVVPIGALFQDTYLAAQKILHDRSRDAENRT